MKNVIEHLNTSTLSKEQMRSVVGGKLCGNINCNCSNGNSFAGIYSSQSDIDFYLEYYCGSSTNGAWHCVATAPC